MNKLLLRLCVAAIFLFWVPRMAIADCVDSVHLDIHSVQCHGLRNGIVRVGKVFGGEKPFFFSIDNQSFSTNTVFDHLWPGAYTLYVRDASNCVREWAFTVPEPEELKVYLFAERDTVTAGQPFGLKAVVTPESTQLISISWRPPNIFLRQDTLIQTVRISEATTFAVEVNTSDGCLARDQRTVEVKKAALYFPNAIKPGSNQDAYFTVFAGEGVSRIVDMQVYSRGGGLIFERHDFQPNDPLKGWGGRWQGRYVQPGVYLWTAVIEYSDKSRERFQGSVTVIN